MRYSFKIQLSIILATVNIFLSGCFTRFYTTNTRSSPDMETTRSAMDSGANVVIHFSDSIVLLNEARVNNDTVSGKPASIPVEYKHFMYPQTTKSNRYRKKEESWLIPQIHMYTNDTFSVVNGSVYVTKEKINRYDFYQTDKKRTATATTISWVMIGISTLAIGLVLAIALSPAGVGGG